jgi:hypothetical protein
VRRREIVEFAEGLLDVRYAHQGRLTSGKLDCLGLVCAVCDHFGIDYVDMPGYSRTPNPERFRKQFRLYTKRGSVDDIREGSIGIFRQGQMPAHLAIFCKRPGGKLAMIHALLTAKKVIRQTFGDPYTALLMEVREFPGVED